MHGHQSFLIPVILAATAALTPARTQTLAPSAETPNSATKSIVSIPDLSGIWGRWFNFEPPLSGPGPIVSKLRRSDGRSEEHTSELQSLRHLVCRLLLE